MALTMYSSSTLIASRCHTAASRSHHAPRHAVSVAPTEVEAACMRLRAPPATPPAAPRASGCGCGCCCGGGGGCSGGGLASSRAVASSVPPPRHAAVAALHPSSPPPHPAAPCPPLCSPSSELDSRAAVSARVGRSAWSAWSAWGGGADRVGRAPASLLAQVREERRPRDARHGEGRDHYTDGGGLGGTGADEVAEAEVGGEAADRVAHAEARVQRHKVPVARCLRVGGGGEHEGGRTQ
eukprot:scaffold92378_cov57-Phaeocystis_antarctica.AAC.4